MTTLCRYPGDRDEILVSYLYDAIDPAERVSFDAHLASCEHCRTELADLRDVRTQLGLWTPPERASVFAHPPGAQARKAGVWARLGEIPVWAQVAAAMLILGVALGIANLEVQYGRDGLVVRTGWSKPARNAAGSVGSLTSTANGPAVEVGVVSAPWRPDLAALERQLRNEFHASEIDTRQMIVARQGVATSPVSGSDADIIRRVRALIDESERRQQREIALRVAEVVRDTSAQRQADMVKIDRSLGFIQNTNTIEVAKQRDLLNYLVHVSQKQ